mmetsp:Transcript_78536/g.159450  ORF Transcript_78536/g.159450 Transcript_78536/m.159450 type:complete len:318 (-) Transcript_78536:233-1186(-)
MLRWHEARIGFVIDFTAAVLADGRPSGRLGSHFEELVQKELDAEIRHGGTKKQGREFPVEDAFHVQRFDELVQEFLVLHEFLKQLVVVDELFQLVGFRKGNLDYLGLGTALGGFLVQVDDFVQSIQDALEALAVPDRPQNRKGFEVEFLLDLVHELVGAQRGPIHFVAKGKEGQSAHPADLEELSRLRFQALGGVQKHDGVVGGRQRPVGVFGKVLVTRRVQNVHPVSLVVEIHDGRRDRDPTLLFHFHEIGLGRPLLGLLPDGTGLLEGSPVQQEFFRHGSLSGIGVADDGQVAAAIDLVGRGGRDNAVIAVQARC